MKIESLTMQFVGTSRRHAGKRDSTPLGRRQDVPTATQAITLQPGSALNLGIINGKPFDFRLFKEGGFEWSGALRLTDMPEPGAPVSAQAKAAAAAAAMDRYSEDEWKHCSDIAGVVFNLYEVARGRLPPEAFNERSRRESVPPEFLQEALSRLGVDPREPFEMNGSAYILRQGQLFRIVDERA
jgi:hypothetical protein